MIFVNTMVILNEFGQYDTNKLHALGNNYDFRMIVLSPTKVHSRKNVWKKARIPHIDNAFNKKANSIENEDILLKFY